LVWERRYNASLRARESPLGPGWTALYFATLTRDRDGFVFVTPESHVERFADASGSVERGAVIRNLGSFQELCLVGNRYLVTRWDAKSGAVVRYSFAAGRPNEAWPLAAIEDPAGLGLDLQYDQAGRLLGVRQRLEQRSLVLDYNHSGTRILAVALLTPDGRRHTLVRYDYDSLGRLAVVFDAAGAADRYEYDGDSQLVRESLKNGDEYQFRYDTRGRCVWTSGLDRYDEKVLRYYEAIRWTEVTDSAGSTTRYEWSATGQVTRIVDPAGGVWQTEYDDHGRIVAEVDGAGAAVRYSYDEAGNRSTITDPLGNTYTRQFLPGHLPLAVTAPTGAVWRREYDPQNRIVATIDPLGGRWLTTYDIRGNPVEVTAPTGAKRRQVFSSNGILLEATDWRGFPTRYTFDDFGRLTETIDHTGHSIRAEYDPTGNPLKIVYGDKTTITFTYDLAGNLTRVRDANGHITNYSYTSHRRLIDRTDSLGARVSLQWGTEPRRLEALINELGETCTFEHDAAGRVLREIGFDGRETSYQYDLAGRTIAIARGDSRITLRRDANGRVVEQLMPDGSHVQYAYDGINNLVQAVNDDCALRFERDAVGRVVREMQDDYAVNTRFDLLGEITGTATNLGLDVSYKRDENSQLTRLVAGTHTIEFKRDVQGRETHRLFSNRLWLERERDAMGNLSRQRVGHGLPPWDRSTTPSTIVARRYSYDPSRELRVIEDDRWGRTMYGYDAARRIVQVTRDAGPSERFSYDAAGNLRERNQEAASEQDAVTELFEYTPGNRLLAKGHTSYFYDGHGRLARKVEADRTPDAREWHYLWDSLDRLKLIRTPSGEEWRYRYDALGRRVAKAGPDGERRYIWAGDTILHELSGQDHLETWLFDPDGYTPLAKLQGREIYPVISDPPGTPRELLNLEGEVVWLAGPVTWRGPSDPTGRIDCPIRFPGQWYDAESGLCYNRFRYYDPEAARFISPDPIGLAGGLNLYAYGPNPLGWMDPWGWNFFRGARGDSPPSFEPRPGEFKVRDGQVQPTHGVSVFDNPTSVSSKGFTPHEIDPASVPDSLRIIQRGKDPTHFEIVPKEPMTEADYRDALAKIRTTPPTPPDGADDEKKPQQDGCD
jgi:RHS repeat-associated protein